MELLQKIVGAALGVAGIAFIVWLKIDLLKRNAKDLGDGGIQKLFDGKDED